MTRLEEKKIIELITETDEKLRKINAPVWCDTMYRYDDEKAYLLEVAVRPHRKYFCFLLDEPLCMDEYKRFEQTMKDLLDGCPSRPSTQGKTLQDDCTTHNEEKQQAEEEKLEKEEKQQAEEEKPGEEEKPDSMKEEKTSFFTKAAAAMKKGDIDLVSEIEKEAIIYFINKIGEITGSPSTGIYKEDAVYLAAALHICSKAIAEQKNETNPFAKSMIDGLVKVYEECFCAEFTEIEKDS